MKSRKQIFKEIASVSFHRPGWMTASILLALLSSLAFLVPYVCIWRIVRTTVTLWPSVGGETSELIRLGLWAFFGAAASLLAYYGALICSHMAAFHTVHDMRLSFLRHLAALPLGFHIRTGSGSLRGVTDSNLGNVQTFLAHKIPDMIQGTVYPVCVVVFMAMLDWRLAFSVLLGIAGAWFFYARSTAGGGIKHEMELYYNALAEMDTAATEYVRGITVVKTFSQTGYAFGKLHQAIEDYTNMVIPYTRNWEKSMCWFEVLVGSLYLLLIPTGLLLWPGTGDILGFAAVWIFFLILSPSVGLIIPRVGRILHDFMNAEENLSRYMEVMAEPELPRAEVTVVPASAEIRFEDVSFSYDGRADALEHMSFVIPEGSKAALVGPSGSGKSTIAHLLARFYDVSSGAIRIGGQDVRSIAPETLNDMLCFVFQGDYLFHMSLADNIRLGRQDASQEEILRAGHAALCDEIAARLPNGYDTVLEQAGVHLSGGEKQRIVIARAILKNAPIVILDEATSALDPENEGLVQEALDHLLVGKTALIIAHRLSVVEHADPILMIEHGRLLDSGSHEELLASCPRYGEMWDSYRHACDWRAERSRK